MLPSANAQSRELPSVAIYYGYPSLVNGAKGDISKAAHVFNGYRLLVLGDGLEMTSHADHANVKHIVSLLRNPRIFGYICIGSTQSLPVEEVHRRIVAWKQTGVHGVFLDEAGNDFKVSHERREQIVDLAHAEGLAVFVNAFQPDDVFAAGTHLRKGDLYLLESFVVRMGELNTSAAMSSRVRQALQYRDRYKVGVVGITTTTNDFSPTLYREACKAAQKASLDGFGWGDPSFSSQSNMLTDALQCLETMPPRLVTRRGYFAGSEPEPSLIAGAQK